MPSVEISAVPVLWHLVHQQDRLENTTYDKVYRQLFDTRTTEIPWERTRLRQLNDPPTVTTDGSDNQES